ncbi:MAG: cell division protein SepF [Mycobacteriales bacterium]|nr:MAG: cell division protein SepF [Pseudonocardiales bacterium]
MANAMRKMGIYLGLVEDDEHRGESDYEGYTYDDAGTAAAKPARSERATARPSWADLAASQPAYDESTPTRITTLHPRTYNEARAIGEQFRESVPVIMNLTEMDDADAKRLVDFAAGLSFGLHGSIERVTNKVFLLSPQNVDVTAEDRARIVAGGFFNQS